MRVYNVGMFTLKPHELLPSADLVSLRDDALRLSNDTIHRFNLLNIEMCTIEASWHTASGGSAYLTDKSSSLRSFHRRGRLPTTLAVYDRTANHLAELTLFRANLEAGDIHVYHHFFTLDTGTDLKAHELGSYKLVEDESKAAGLDIPTPADLLLLQTELERGAAGAYTAASEALEHLQS